MIPVLLPNVYFSKTTSALLLAVSLHTIAIAGDFKKKLPKCPFSNDGEGNSNYTNYSKDKQERGNSVDNNIYLKNN